MTRGSKLFLITILVNILLIAIEAVPFPSQGAKCWKKYERCCKRNGDNCHQACQALYHRCETQSQAPPTSPESTNDQPEPHQPETQEGENSVPPNPEPTAPTTTTEGQAPIVAGDLEYYDLTASGHQSADGRYGRTLNTFELDAIGSVLGLPSPYDIKDKMDAMNWFSSPTNPDDKKIAGAYLILSVMAKFKVMPPQTLAENTHAMNVYGQLKIAGMEGNAAKINEVLSANGGNSLGLSDEQLVQLWGGNEHQNLHAVIGNNSPMFHAIHATSLSDNSHSDKGCPVDGLVGGYNDKGECPEWDWFTQALSFNTLF